MNLRNRFNNLVTIKNHLNFDYIDEWIIVYDGKRVSHPHLFNDPKISEYIISGDGIEGNPQRNYGIQNVKNQDTYIYFLDDDNIIHPDFYTFLDNIEPNKLYTFDQTNSIHGTLYGNNIYVGGIDTAMFTCQYSLVKDIYWGNHTAWADGVYIVECYNKNKDKHIYVNKILSYWNYLTSNTKPKPSQSSKLTLIPLH